MAQKFFNRARQFSPTTGTGDAITLGSAFNELFLTLAEAGGASGDTTDVVVEQGTNFAIYAVTVGASAASISITSVRKSKIGGTAGTARIDLDGSAVIRFIESAENLNAILSDFVRYDVAQSKTDGEKTQARTNVGSAPYEGLESSNIVINGAMLVPSEYGTTGLTLASGSVAYSVEQMLAIYINTGAVVVSKQLPSTSFPVALPGFTFGHDIQATTALTSLSSGDLVGHLVRIEGYRVADLGWGGAGAAPAVVAGELYSTAAGVAVLRLANNAQDRLYYHEITIAAGWNFFALSAPGDTSGAWLKDNGVGLRLSLITAGFETTPMATLGAWSATNKVQTTNSTNLFATNNNRTILTGVYIGPGTQLPTADMLPRLMRTKEVEEVLCRRYWRETKIAIGAVKNSSTTDCRLHVNFESIPMRTTPTPGAAGVLTIDDQVSTFTQSSASVSADGLSAEGGRISLPNFTGLTALRQVALSSTSNALRFSARM
jgi:hypothetical protein